MFTQHITVLLDHTDWKGVDGNFWDWNVFPVWLGGMKIF